MYHSEIMQLYRDGMAEAKRILMGGGLLMVKCQDEVESSSQRRSHIEIHAMATAELGLKDEDLFLLVQPLVPTIQFKEQQHARNNNSFLWVFRK
ncbi:hypothetical protein ACFL34_00590 [Candidatus Sumerlaeota bacterium]